MGEADTPADAHVAHLIAKHPQKGGCWKEVFVFRHHKMVHCYRMESLARRWYRRLEFTTNAKLTMYGLQPSISDRRQLWPKWGRHAADDNTFYGTLSQLAPPAYTQSVEICRGVGMI